MKFKFLPAIIFLLTVGMFSACKKDNDDPDATEKVLVIDNGALSIQPDESPTYSAKFVHADGTTSAAAGVTWTTSDANVCGISASGTISVQNVGAVTITATVTEGDITYTAVTPLGIASVSFFAVLPSAIIYEPGHSLQLETVYLGTTLPSNYTFSSSNTGVASVNGSGLVTFNSPGFAVLTVTADNHPNAPVQVPVQVVGIPTVALPITRVEITPPQADIFRGESVQLSAQAYNTSGSVSADFVWETSDASVISVDANGRVTGLEPGDALVYATASGITGQAEIFVSPDTIVEVTPLLASIPAGGTRQFTAKAYDARNGYALLPGITNFNWEIPAYGIDIF
ncbi:MAG: Ig-like domain-containing protein, partial [Bacteroidota bacterium]